MLGRSCCLVLLLAAISGCGGASEATDEKKTAPEYAATPRKALESWVTAVRAGDIEMMCRLLYPRGGCAASDRKAYTKPRFLRHVRAEMRGLNGSLRYGAIAITDPGLTHRVVIGVVSGESPVAYAVPVRRGMIQWSISVEAYPFYAPHFAPKIVLDHPDPSAVLASGRTAISFTASVLDPGSSYPNAELWIDSRHVNGRLERGPSGNVERVRWIGTARLLPGRHVMVAGVRPDLAANAWLLTVR